MEGVEHVKDLLRDWLGEDDSDDDISLDEDYEENRDYFYANTCHVCHCLDRGKRLKRCAGCYMISYCDNSHQAKHWPVHKQICKIMKEIITSTKGSSIFGNSKNMSQKEWTKVKTNVMLIVSLKLGRSLSPSEQNMFKFPRACFVCHESDPKVLTNCPSCGNASFCKDHATDSRHKSLCSKFFICHSFDLLRTYTMNMSIAEIVTVLLDSEAMDFVHYSKEIVKPPSNMRKFLDTYFKNIVKVRRETSRPEYWDIFISEYFTRPLTLISAMKIMNFEPKNDFVVHILGSNSFELDICAWEIILHWFPQVQTLKLILIGPELLKDNMRPDLCSFCLYNKRSLIVEAHNVFYHHYVDKEHSKPNLVIGYNIGIGEFENPGSEDDTWKPTILALPDKKVPFIFTAYTEEEAQKDHERICLFLERPTDHFWFGKNQFASLKPVRDFETEGVFYQNNYLIVYNNLPTKDEKMEDTKSAQEISSEVKEENSQVSFEENKKSVTSNSTKNKNMNVPNLEENKDQNLKLEELREKNEYFREKMKQLQIATKEDKKEQQ